MIFQGGNSYLSLLGFVDLNQDGVAWKRANRRHVVAGENVGACALIHPLIVRLIPLPLVKTGNTGHDIIRDFCRRVQSASLVENDHPISVLDFSTAGVFRIDPQCIVSYFFNACNVVEL